MSASEKPPAQVLVPRHDKRPKDPHRPKDHHTEEWSTGERGGGSVPEDFSWRTNPKQWQEELGSPDPKRRLDD